MVLAMATYNGNAAWKRIIAKEEALIESTTQEEPEGMYFPNGERWTWYTEHDIFGNTYFEAVGPNGPHRVTVAPAARLF
jgi:hypothetical protein